MIAVTVQFFGALKGAFQVPEVELLIPSTATVAEIKLELSRLMSQKSKDPGLLSLLKVSAIADESKVLNDRDRILTGTRLAILPPVCGG